MKKTFSNVWSGIRSFISKRPKTSILLGVVILLILGATMIRGGSGPSIETAQVVRGDVIEEVGVTGKVVPVQKVDLAFEKGGLVAGVYVAVGEHVTAGKTLGGLEVGELYATVLQEEARLSELQQGTRPEELAVTRTKAANADKTVSDARITASNAIRDAYVKVEDAFRNNVDELFDNPTSPNPTINIATPSREVEKSINAQRAKITTELAAWAKELSSLSSNSDVTKSVASAQSHINEAKKFFDTLIVVLNWLSGTKSGESTEVSGYRETATSAQTQVIAAGSALSTASATLTSAEAALKVAQNELTLAESGSTPEAIKIQQAKVLQARSALQKSSIISPISGIVAQVVPKVGEIVSGGQVAFTVISDNAYQIEVQIPEADIAKVDVGDEAEITLDAYGKSVVFKGRVSQVDPAETIVEGVPTYKVVVQFIDKDSRVRSGMTANIDILSDSRTQVLIIPTRAVIDRGMEKVVRIPQGDSYVEKSVQTGLKSSDGVTEIISGLSLGDKVVTFVK